MGMTDESKFRSRKWLLTLIIQVPATALVALGKISSADYAQISMANITAYGLANAAEYFTKMSKAK